MIDQGAEEPRRREYVQPEVVVVERGKPAFGFCGAALRVLPDMTSRLRANNAANADLEPSTLRAAAK